MEKEQTFFDLKTSESAEALWENFERTGSVKDFLRFVQKTQNLEDLVPADLLTRV